MTPPSQRAFFIVSALLFFASAALTMLWCTPAPAMPACAAHAAATPHDLSSQGWPGAIASFVGMWTVMMVAMMLPSLVPMLRRYREAMARTGETRLGRLTTVAGVGYFLVWTVVGMAAFPAGVALAAIEMPQTAAQAVPIARGAIVLIAGALQFTAWKARRLACCQEAGRCIPLPPDAGTALRHGMRLWLDCVRCCANLMAILLVVGVMDLRAMTLVTVAITAERLAPAGQRGARVVGALVIAAAVSAIAPYVF